LKFTPKSLEGNVNVARTHPLKELLWMLGGMALLLGMLVLILGFSTDLVVSKMPVSVETWLGRQMLKKVPGEESAALERRLQSLLASLPADSPLHQYVFRVFTTKSDAINAIALPGGNIVVYSGLLNNVQSENELAMVLAHELGHFAHRDHLRGMGRGLGVAVATGLLFGGDSGASDLVSKSLLTYQAQYSRSQEAAADRFGLDLLVSRYGHAGGATPFFLRLSRGAGGHLPYLFASHPHPQSRIDDLNKRIQARHYPVNEVLPLAGDVRH
jgi:predicted Zn-dependent protease